MIISPAASVSRRRATATTLSGGGRLRQVPAGAGRFPAATLHETIPRFHDTEDRLCQLRASVEADACGRVREAGPELAFISAREQELGTLCRMLRSGALPLRVTHNDTKLNNVLLDEKNGPCKKRARSRYRHARAFGL